MEIGEPVAAAAGGAAPAPPAPPPPKKYRLQLRLGDVDMMFPAVGTNDHTDDGVRKRLQAIGFLYENISSANIGQRAQDAWTHFKKIIGVNSNSAAVRELKRRVRQVIVEYGSLPAKDHFRKIRFPGTYCVTDAHYRAPANFFGSPQNAGGTSYHYQQETTVWNDNTALGAIPIIARVYVKEAGKPWKRAVGVHVRFMFDDPAALPAKHSANIPALRTTSPSLPGPPVVAFTGSPNQYITTEKGRNPPTGDHLVDNAHTSVGGKRGNPIAGNARTNLLETANARVGFHDVCSFTPATASGSEAIAETNAQGEGAVVFMPAWTGGDRYKLKAILQEDGSVTAETGTMVVWRILRFSKYLRWNYPSGTTAAQRTRCNGSLSSFNMRTVGNEYKKAWLDVIKELEAQSPQSLLISQWRAGMNYAIANAQANAVWAWAQPYDLNSLFMTTRQYFPHTVTMGQTVQSIANFYTLPNWRSVWYSSRNTALRNLRHREDNLQGGDVLQIPLGGPHPGIMNFLNRRQYDLVTQPPNGPGAFLPASGDANYWNNMSCIFFAMISEFIRYFSKDAISGLVIVQSPGMDALFVDQPPGLPGNVVPFGGNSGWGTQRRGCYVVFGKAAYTDPGHWMPYDHSRNCLHESGHVLYGVHQYTAAPNFATNTGSIYDEHDYHDLCIMGYMACDGDQCGRCLLNRAGWNVRAMPANNPGP
jgi:hypothetical protein